MPIAVVICPIIPTTSPRTETGSSITVLRVLNNEFIKVSGYIGKLV